MRRVVLRLSREVKRKVYGLTGSIPHPDKWLFVVGCYNSGTTLLKSLLGCHPGIGSMRSEGQFYTDQLLVPQEVGLKRAWALQPERFRMLEPDGEKIDVQRIKRQWQRAFNDSQRPVLMEKSPPNAARIRWLNTHFENAHFVGIVRNPYATIEGMMRKGGLDLEQAARQWVGSNEIMLSDLERVDHRMLITYEQLTNSPSGVFAEMVAFLGLDAVASPSMTKTFRIHERELSIRNLNRDSIKRLSPDELKRITDLTHSLQTRLGYESVSGAGISDVSGEIT